MKTKKTTFLLIVDLWNQISPRRRGQFFLLLFLMISASFSEILSIGAVLPFLGALVAPDRIFQHSYVQPFINVMGLTSPNQLVLPLAIAFGTAAFIAGAMRLLLLWASTRLSFATGADLSVSIYQRTLYQPYAVHISRNSSELINGIAVKAKNVINMLMMILTIVSSCVMLVTILIAIMYVDPVIACAAFSGFGLIYYAIIKATKNQLTRNSGLIAKSSTQVIKSLQEGLGGIRDILIDGSQAVYCETYRKADLVLRDAGAKNSFISACPRYAMEALGMMLIAALAYWLFQQPDGATKVIPVLGVLALGAQRLLPVLQQAYGAWTSILGGQASLQDTLELLNQPLPDYVNEPVSNPLPFQNSISLSKVLFRYHSELPLVLNSINLTIPKGSRVGFIGETGSGKSTLLDIIMGLLQPTEGEMLIDNQLITLGNNRAWQAHIAHVPQTIFLADSSIEENIAFGVKKNKIDHERVRAAARKAKIHDAIESWPKKYDTFVGERGIRLSGGQRQRIGIARALYKKADILIFDEATSALDNETEEAVMQAIDDLGDELTILIIAHRLTTLRSCTQIVELSNGNVKRIGSYRDIVNI